MAKTSEPIREWILPGIPAYKDIGDGPQSLPTVQRLVVKGVLKRSYPLGRAGHGVKRADEYPEIERLFVNAKVPRERKVAEISFPDAIMKELQERTRTTSLETPQEDTYTEPELGDGWLLPSLPRFEQFQGRPQSTATLERLIQRGRLQPYHEVTRTVSDTRMAAGEFEDLIPIFREHVDGFDSGFWRKTASSGAHTPPAASPSETQAMFDQAFDQFRQGATPDPSPPTTPPPREPISRPAASSPPPLSPPRKPMGTPAPSSTMMEPPENAFAKIGQVGVWTGISTAVPFLLLNLALIGMGVGIQYIPFMPRGAVLWFLMKVVYDLLVAIGACTVVATIICLASDQQVNDKWTPGKSVLLSLCYFCGYGLVMLNFLPNIPFFGDYIYFAFLVKQVLQGLVVGYVAMLVEHSLAQNRKVGVYFGLDFDEEERHWSYGAAGGIVLAMLLNVGAVRAYHTYEGGIANQYTNDAGLMVIDVRGKWLEEDPGTYVVTGIIQNELEKPWKFWHVEFTLVVGDRVPIGHGKLQNKSFSQTPADFVVGSVAQQQRSQRRKGAMMEYATTLDQEREKISAANRARREALDSALFDYPTTDDFLAAAERRRYEQKHSGVFGVAMPTPTPTVRPTATPNPSIGWLKPRENYPFRVVFTDLPEEPDRIIVMVSQPLHGFIDGAFNDPSNFDIPGVQ